MKRMMRSPVNNPFRVFTVAVVLLTVMAVIPATVQPEAQRPQLPSLTPFPNANGILQTFNTTGNVDLTGPFFQSLGTNGRACSSCHLPNQGWTISADSVRHRFVSTQGLDPIFRTNDGSNCNHNVDVSTLQGRERAYTLLTSRGLIRVALPVPQNAEFDVVGVNNPYGCNETDVLSMYRRPLPSANLRFVSALMWDGRESTPQTGTQRITYEPQNPGAILLENLKHQSIQATLGHAQAVVAPTPQQRQEIVDFEMGLFTAQAFDFIAGPLFGEAEGGPKGGPVSVAFQPFFIGINDPIDALGLNRPDLGFNPFHDGFTPEVFNLFGTWFTLQPSNAVNRARASIARGEKLFNTKTINIFAVSGLNDELGISVIPGTCGTCHDSPNVGNHSFPTPLDIGVGDLRSPLNIAYLPVITLRTRSPARWFKRPIQAARSLPECGRTSAG